MFLSDVALTLPDAVTLLAMTQQIPEPGAKSRDGLGLDQVTATAGTYDDAHAALPIPDGHRLISVRRA